MLVMVDARDESGTLKSKCLAVESTWSSWRRRRVWPVLRLLECAAAAGLSLGCRNAAGVAVGPLLFTVAACSCC